MLKIKTNFLQLLSKNKKEHIKNKVKYVLLKVYFMIKSGSLFNLFTPKNKFPKIVHLMYFPWDKHQNLKNNENDFDHSFYDQFVSDNPKWQIELWTVSRVKKFANSHYPGLWEEIWEKIQRPTQAVDFFRLLVTYHFGGIYWQYESKQISKLELFIPRGKKSSMLFIEAIWSPDDIVRTSAHPIRKGKPEEQLRVCNQIFSAYPKAKFLKYCMDKARSNLQQYDVKTDYDILYIGANAMVSEAYDEFVFNNLDFKSIILVPVDVHHRMFSLSSRGSWRTDENT